MAHEASSHDEAEDEFDGATARIAQAHNEDDDDAAFYDLINMHM